MLPPQAERWPLERAEKCAGYTLSDGARRHAQVWLDLVAQWNAKLDLTAAKTPEDLVELGLTDALVLAGRVAQGARVVDVGTGMGAPGVPLALARPDLAVTLCEPMQKRIAFLRTVLGTTGRTDVTLVHGRGEALAREAWDVAISRATLSPSAWLELGAALVVPGGTIWVLLARDAAPSAPGATLIAEHAYSWGGVARRAVLYRRAPART
jgi:16S rRNA (guanine527-N7)-methyltransferase